jgi:N-acetylmuramoyl-L-alanine amidase
MPKYVVKHGDYLSLIANRFKIADWKTIYNHPENEEFRKKRPDPNVIKPKDEIFVPDAEPKKISAEAEKKHRFVSKVQPPLEIEVVLQDEDREPLANAAWTLIGDHLELHGTTDKEGLMTAKVPHGTSALELVLDETDWMRWDLDIGGLDPIDDGGDPFAPGIQARLNNLGFDCGEVDGEIGPRTTSALADFQRVILERETPTGEIDSETLERLVDEHGA